MIYLWRFIYDEKIFSAISKLQTNLFRIGGATYWGQVLSPAPSTTETTSHKVWITLAAYPSWECKLDTRQFHDNKFNAVFIKNVWFPKHLRRVCNCNKRLWISSKRMRFTLSSAYVGHIYWASMSMPIGQFNPMKMENFWFSILRISPHDYKWH